MIILRFVIVLLIVTAISPNKTLANACNYKSILSYENWGDRPQGLFYIDIPPNPGSDVCGWTTQVTNEGKTDWRVWIEKCDGSTEQRSWRTIYGEVPQLPDGFECPCDEEQAQQDAESTCQNSLDWRWTDQDNCEWECIECDQEEARQQAQQTCGDYWEWTNQNRCEWDCEPDDEDNFGDEDGDNNRDC
jgi:hypothetical protein